MLFFWQCPQNLEERNSLPSRRGGESAISAGLLFDRNLEIPIPDIYRPPPAPLPYDVVLGTHPQIPSGNLENNVKNAGITRDSVSGCTLENLLASEDAETDTKGKIDSEVDIIESGIEPSKSTKSAVVGIYEEDVCPICLEGKVFSLSYVCVDACPWNVVFTCYLHVVKYASMLVHMPGYGYMLLKVGEFIQTCETCQLQNLNLWLASPKRKICTHFVSNFNCYIEE